LKINPITAKDPLQLARTMAHEIGHGIDWLPDKLLGIPRGDMLGRVMTLDPLNKALSGLRVSMHNLLGRTDAKTLEKEATDVSAWWRPGNMATQLSQVVDRAIRRRSLRLPERPRRPGISAPRTSTASGCTTWARSPKC
jgi:hypothetical protein